MANDSLARGAPRASYGPITGVTEDEWTRIFGKPEVGLYKVQPSDDQADGYKSSAGSDGSTV
jgi:hypothetical protein